MLLSSHTPAPAALQRTPHTSSRGRCSPAAALGVGVPSVPSLMSATDSWRLLRGHADEPGEIPHLRELLADTERCSKMFAEHDGIILDYSRQARIEPRIEGLARVCRREELSYRPAVRDAAHDAPPAPPSGRGARG
jgi:hypothetical protein